MGRLKTIQPRLKVLNTQRLKPFISEKKRISGNARYSLKRSIYVRDGGHCCMCQRVVDLHDSELDHSRAENFPPDEIVNPTVNPINP
jgi:5-methylcytosine-specific restriction protein A